MGFLYSPMKLIELIKNRDFFTKDMNTHDAKWYFTKEGEVAYRSADTPAKKVKYFFDYLTAAPNTATNQKVRFRTAYIMANFVEGSSLEFAKYPDILDAKKNPLIEIRFINRNVNEIVGHGLLMLAKLHNETNALKYLDCENDPYTFLTPLEKDGSMSDKYKLERAIIGAFCTEYPGQYMPPYMYDIHVTEDDSDSEN